MAPGNSLPPGWQDLFSHTREKREFLEINLLYLHHELAGSLITIYTSCPCGGAGRIYRQPYTSSSFLSPVSDNSRCPLP